MPHKVHNLVTSKIFLFAISVILLSSLPASIFAATPASVGPNSPTTAANIAGPNVDWANPQNVTTSDDVSATAALSPGSPLSDVLVANGFGFNVPAGVTINGIAVDIERTSTNTGRDLTVNLTKNGTAAVGTSLAVTNVNWPSSDAVATYGNSTNLWGTTWTSSEINSPTFGLAISAQRNTGTPTPAIDHITITVTYTDNAAPTPGAHITPVNGTSVNTNPILTWNNATDNVALAATPYVVTISNDTGFTNIVETSLAQSGTTYPVSSTLVSGTQYYWKVAVSDAQANTANSVPTSFIFDNTAPIAPVNVAIASNNVDTTKAKSGDTVTVTATVEAGSTLTGTIGNQTATGNVNATTGTLTRVLNGSETVGLLGFSFTLTDSVNNTGSAITAVAGTGNTTSVTTDFVAPSVVLSTPSNSTNTAPFVVTATFSEAVTGVTIGDFTIVNGTASNFVPVNSTTYTIDVTPSSSPITINMPSSVASDLTGNANTASNQLTVSYTNTNSSVVSGIVFADNNGNGIQDLGDLGIANRTVILVDGNGTRLVDQTTNVNGTYSFSGVAPGALLVQTAPVPVNHLPSTGFNSYARPTIAGGTTNTVNFPMTPISLPNLATVNGTVFEDINNDGIRNGNDTGLAGVQVFVVDFLTLTQTTVLTNANGTYTATGVLPDVVLVQAAPIPAGHLPNAGNFTYSYPTLSQGSTTTVNFALRQVAPIQTGTIIFDVFSDVNKDGIKALNETGVTGAAVFTFELLTAQANVQFTNSTGSTTHSGLIPDVVLAQINASPFYLTPLGFNTITTANGGFQYVTVNATSPTTVQIGLAQVP